MLADAIDRVKTSREPVTLVAVGGGAPLVPEDLPGTSEVLRPDHSDVANADRGRDRDGEREVDRVFHLGAGAARPRSPRRRRRAIERAVAAGAARDSVEVVEIEEVPLAYLTDPAVRIRVKAGGPLVWG